MFLFLTLIITIYKIKNMPALPSSLVTSLLYGFSLLLTLPNGEYVFTDDDDNGQRKLIDLKVSLFSDENLLIVKLINQEYKTIQVLLPLMSFSFWVITDFWSNWINCFLILYRHKCWLPWEAFVASFIRHLQCVGKTSGQWIWSFATELWINAHANYWCCK